MSSKSTGFVPVEEKGDSHLLSVPPLVFLSRLRSVVSAVGEVPSAFLWREEVEKAADLLPKSGDGSCRHASEHSLEL